MIRNEEKEQELLMRWMELQHPEAFAVTHHSPNGGIRNKITAARFKRMGTKRGFPDIAIYLPRNGFCGLVVELKATGGSNPTREQLQWLEDLSKCGFMATWCKGFDAAQKTINNYLMGEGK